MVLHIAILLVNIVLILNKTNYHQVCIGIIQAMLMNQVHNDIILLYMALKTLARGILVINKEKVRKRDC